MLSSCYPRAGKSVARVFPNRKVFHICAPPLILGTAVVSYKERLRGKERIDFVVDLCKRVWICIGGIEVTIRREFLGDEEPAGDDLEMPKKTLIGCVDHCLRGTFACIGSEQALAPGRGAGTFAEGAWDKLMETKGM